MRFMSSILRLQVCLLFLMVVWGSSALAVESVDVPADGESEEVPARAEWSLETAPYYTSIGYNLPLTSRPIPTINSADEAEIYHELIKGSLLPRYMTLEASIYPVPAASVYIKSHSQKLYDAGNISRTGINIFESAAAGYQEPYAVSAFFGNVAKLRRPGDSRIGNNWGYTGYLISYGNRHIKDTLQIFDNWYELGWKITGKMDYPDENLSWSFRMGVKNHAHPNIVDVFYLSLFRSNMGFRLPFLSWMDNSDVDIKLFFSQVTGKVVREEYFVGKKYPVSGIGMAPTLDFGLVWTSAGEYTGSLRSSSPSKWTLLFRPSIEF